MTGCWNGKVAGYRLNILIFMLFILIFNIIFVMRTCIVTPYSDVTFNPFSDVTFSGIKDPILRPWRHQDACDHVR
ncbi:hypothetical protein EAO17_27670 [Klebsiella pneumoniae]|uniref:Uncharacterized protein n=1 Tax=Klebsiella pneumoniae TaxID=573 RepID=A0ABD7J4Q2_KLEPN|nr:hypothetical protein EAO17_27670 [Klebsiella pneumoniae]